MAHNHHSRASIFHITPAHGGGLTGRLFALSNVLFSFANLMTLLSRWGKITLEEQQRDEIHELRAENLRLKNEREFIRQGIDSNRVIEMDQKIELNQLKIAREKWEQETIGITAPKFQADSYADPGDVRRGKIPPPA